MPGQFATWQGRSGVWEARPLTPAPSEETETLLQVVSSDRVLCIRTSVGTLGDIFRSKRASRTQLIQELVNEGMHAIKKYEPTMDKTMRMHSVMSTIENGFVHLPDKAAWLGEYLHELASFPKGKYDDQADSNSQALDWFKQQCMTPVYGLLEYWKQEAEKMKAGKPPISDSPLINRGALLREWDRAGFPFGRY